MKSGQKRRSPSPIPDGIWLDDTYYPMRPSGFAFDSAMHIAFNIRALTKEHPGCRWFHIGGEWFPNNHRQGIFDSTPVHDPFFGPGNNPFEQAFLSLAKDWHQIALEAGKDGIIPSEADLPSLGCLLLAKERRSSLGVACKSAIQNNFDLGKDSPFRMHDGLVWELCAAGFRKEPTTDAGVTFLTSTLGHSNSALRIWAMRMGWIVREWLSQTTTVPILLKNVADTLGGVEMAAGLAAAFFADSEAFFDKAETFEPPSTFVDQYSERLAQARIVSVDSLQVPFIREENTISKLIGDRYAG